MYVIAIPRLVRLYVEGGQSWYDKIYLFYTTYISVDLAHHQIFRTEVGKGGISCRNYCLTIYQLKTCYRFFCHFLKTVSLNL